VPVLRVTAASPITLDGFTIENTAGLPACRVNAGGTISNIVINAEGGRGPSFSRSGGPVLIKNCSFTCSSSLVSAGVGAVSLNGPGLVTGCAFDVSGAAISPGLTIGGISMRDCVVEAHGDEGAIFLNDVQGEHCEFSFSASYGGLSISGGSLARCALNGNRGQISIGDAAVSDCTLHASGNDGLQYVLALSGSASLTNCRISGGTDRERAIIASGTARMANCLIRNLSSPQSLIQLAPSCMLDNCIIWGNTFGASGQLFAPVPDPGAVNRSCIQGWAGFPAGVGNIGLDPMLDGAGHLLPGSPCIDAGGNAALPPSATRDLAGNCRITDGDFNGSAIVDMGPYETRVCYANCDCGTDLPILNVADFTCFLQRFAAGDTYANCDNSTTAPTLNVADFTCFLQQFAAGCP
jgi:hypothetical protein